MSLQFNSERHEYRLDGALIPSVTQILRPLTDHEYRYVAADVMERASALGTAVHRMIELDCAGILDEAALHDDLRIYLGQWRQFRAQSGFVPIHSEQRVCSRAFGYAGTLDLIGRLNGRIALIDAKRCASVPKTAGPQTAGYETAFREQSGMTDPIDRFALHLAPERWRLVPFTDPADKRVFLASLTLHRWLN